MLINDTLPASAQIKRAWWSSRNQGALQASAWMEAGYLFEKLDIDKKCVKFRKQPNRYTVQRVDGTVQWNADLIKAMRLHMGLTQADFAERLGVRQQTVSEWKTVYITQLASLQST